MSLRTDASPTRRDGARLQHVLQVGATIRTFAQPGRTYVVVNAQLSEMQEVLKTAIHESLEMISDKGIGHDRTNIDIAGMSNEKFNITVDLEEGGSKAVVRGVVEKFGLDLDADPHEFYDNSEDGLLSNVRAFVMLSGATHFTVKYMRKADEAS